MVDRLAPGVPLPGRLRSYGPRDHSGTIPQEPLPVRCGREAPPVESGQRAGAGGRNGFTERSLRK